MRRLFILALFVLTSCGGSIDLSKDQQFIEYLTSEEQEMFELVNQHRQSIGKQKLKAHSEASYQSQKHSYRMSVNGSLTHNGFSNRINEIKKVESRSVVKSGENVAYNSSVVKAHKALLKSSGHRKNIEGDFTHVGIGQETDSNGRMYFTQIFIKLK